MSGLTFDRADAAAGLIFIAFGLVFGALSLGLDLGTALRMGPGYFPAILSAVLLILGVVILAQSVHVTAEGIGPAAWRGMLFILPAPIFFGLTVRGLGFVPSIFFTTVIAGLATRKMGIVGALVLAAGVTVFSTLVFSYGLGLPFRRFGPWLPTFVPTF